MHHDVVEVQDVADHQVVGEDVAKDELDEDDVW